MLGLYDGCSFTVIMFAICKSCQHVAVADLQGMIAAGRGDVPVPDLRWRSTACGARNVGAMVSAMPYGQY